MAQVGIFLESRKRKTREVWMMRSFVLALIGTFTLSMTAAATAPPAATAQPTGVLFENVRIFDGSSDRLSPPSNVLVVGNVIQAVSIAPVAPPAGAIVQRIDGGGRTLMPGLIDAHVHMMMANSPMQVVLSADPNFIALVAGRGATETLMRGFTSVRDAGGPSFGLKHAIDQGILPGPRIWPSGATISQTSGHGDYRSSAHDLPAGQGRDPHFTERAGFAVVADGRPQVLQAVREQLMQGASQIKLMAGGGVASNYDPLDVTQFTEDEMRAAVEAAAAWNTYIMVHAYTPKAIQQAIRAGVRCIEHAQLTDEDTARLAAKEGVWWSMQPFLDDEDAVPFPEGSANRAKFVEMTRGTDNAYALAKKHGVKLAFGTDTLFDPTLAARQGKQLAKMTRWFTPAEALRMATHDNAELLAMSGPRNPYAGRLGVVEEGALADLLLVDGDPLANLSLIATPETSFVVIMKDGKVYKNLLSR
jgi:imidazolonepropionase-like amidohydrolase